ncbi:uncharacterized protein Bfra_001495 [Botrytis fragariae]|uniref:Uncharacterized protein n=1 Tax=Botrytis fragariae TaxID=1964551 RepID=A0A8H6B119_9HELO|nr:uncharacterized protein Bfra_001495 [Botrytis fragariae]KAF5877132.1 hypothetical protein Bfra_001495 [Botrytis fragariae]
MGCARVFVGTGIRRCRWCGEDEVELYVEWLDLFTVCFYKESGLRWVGLAPVPTVHQDLESNVNEYTYQAKCAKEAVCYCRAV